jgi:MoaA/NifB/PqqE/SkfB family radical SAM enzyme
LKERREFQAVVDDEGRLVLPPELAARLGITPGVTIHIDEVDHTWHIRQPVTRLGKVYVEPTSRCNLACRTCIRNAWDEPMGNMADTTFARILDGLRAFSLPLTVFFGGFGEPLSHPGIVDMVAQAKTLGASVELITNGTLLTAERSQQLIAAGLDVLWVSLDGATPESYTDVRLGAELPGVIQNIECFRAARPIAQLPAPEIGIVFVALRRNIGDLPQLLPLARRLGATRFLVSNVLPHTPQMRDEVLYMRAMNNDVYAPSPRQPDLSMPKMDADEIARPPLYEAICGDWNLTFTGSLTTSASDRCPFIEAGATAIGWDGSLSPCLSLLHSSHSYLNSLDHAVRRYVIGNVNERCLLDLWQDPDYVAFRAKVQAFDFAPCTICDGCLLSETNEEDCYGNGFPTCGGCLWAQGLVQCP